LILAILLHLSNENEQISELKDNKVKISSLSLGLINCCCVSITSISNKNIGFKNDIIKTGILTQL
jgi:hypothetical protein